MQQIEYDKVPERWLAAAAATIGNFDGVHLGHRAIIAKLLEHSKRLNIPAAVITFEPHPREVIFRGQKVPAILPFPERVRLITELGIDVLIKVNFTPDFAARTAADFVRDLIKKLNPRAVVIGHDFRFGKDREGDGELLAEIGRTKNFQVETVAAVEVDGQPVSSSRIRALLQAGEIRRANRLLGSAFHLEGEVIHGHHRGKELGFATANLRWTAELLPPEGVYVAAAEWDDQRAAAVVNIGHNPTFGDPALSLEAHLLNFSGDLYQQRIRLAFLRRLRGEIKFSATADLAAQIQADVAQAKEILAAEAGFSFPASPADAAGGDGEPAP